MFLAQITCHDHANYHIKGKAVPLHSNRQRPKVEEHLYPHSTLARDRVGGQHHNPGALPPRKRLSTQLQEAEWASGQVWWVQKISHRMGSNPLPSNL